MGLLSRLVVKCVRSTTSLAVTMDLALGQVILLLVVSSLVGANSETFRVSSSGDAARIQGTMMGDYMPTSSAIQGHPVYEKTNGHKNFLYVSPNGFWTVGSVRGSTVSGIYNSQFPTPSLPPTSGWRYLDGKEWKEDTTLKVEKKSASSAGDAAEDSVSAVDSERQLLLKLLKLFAQRGVAPQAPAPRTPPSTAAVTRAAPTTATAAACPLKIQVRIDSDDGLPTNTDSGQAANRYAGKGNDGQASEPTQDYRGTYTRSDFDSADGYPTYKNIANPAMTVSRVTTVTGTKWQMNGGTSGSGANYIQGTTKPTNETVATAVCSTANPPVPAVAVTATVTPQKVLCTLIGPHLIVNSNDSCPPESGWSFKVGPTGTGTALFKKTAHV